MTEAETEVNEDGYANEGFTMKLDNSKVIKGIVDTLSSIIDETEFLVDPDKFVIQAMDPSRICLLNLTMRSEVFDEFECGKLTKIGLNLDDLSKIMKRATSNDSIELGFDPARNKMKVIMEREGTSKKRTFSLSILDIDMEEIPMDNLNAIEYPSSFKIDPAFLIEAIKDAEIYSEILKLKVIEGEGLTFSSSGQIGEMVYSLNLDDLLGTDFNGKGKGQYSLVFLKSIMKISKITEMLEISLKTDHPLKFEFTLLEGGDMLYYLAPRVEDTEFDDEDMDEF
jgi:proliferating cell nuclear antigen